MCVYIYVWMFVPVSLVVPQIVVTNYIPPSASSLCVSCMCVSVCMPSLHDHSQWKLLFFATLDVSLHSFFSPSSSLQVALCLDTVRLIYIHSQARSRGTPTVVQRVALTETSDALCCRPILPLLSFGSVCLLLFLGQYFSLSPLSLSLLLSVCWTQDITSAIFCLFFIINNFPKGTKANNQIVKVFPVLPQPDLAYFFVILLPLKYRNCFIHLFKSQSLCLRVRYFLLQLRGKHFSVSTWCGFSSSILWFVVMRNLPFIYRSNRLWSVKAAQNRSWSNSDPLH